MEEDGEGVEQLRERLQELQQKLVMAEQAVNDKEGELKDIREALKNAKEEAAMDLQREREAAEETNRESEKKIVELKEQVTNLRDYVGECKEALVQQEAKSELVRLKSVETLREKFDREREMYLARIKGLVEKLAVEASRADHDPTLPSAESEKEKEDAPTASGGESVHGVSGKESVESECIKESRFRRWP